MTESKPVSFQDETEKSAAHRGRLAKTMTKVFLVLSTIVTLVVMIPGFRGGLGTLGFILWALLPYGLFLGLISGISWGQQEVRVHVSSLIAAVCMFCFTLMIYNPAVIRGSSTGALIFVFGPPYVAILGFVVFGLCRFIAWLVLPRTNLSQTDGFCTCGYPLYGLSSPRCPECGKERLLIKRFKRENSP